MRPPTPYRTRLAAMALALTVCGCQEALTPATETHQAGAVTVHLYMVSGSGQTGIVNAPLTNPYVVQLIDSLGRPVAGTVVRGRTIGKWAGTVDSLVLTDQQGFARLHRVLGPQVGMQQAFVRSSVAPRDTAFFTDAAASTAAFRRP